MSQELVFLIFLLAFASDFGRTAFELVVNLRHRRTRRPGVTLRPDEVAVVIPCHDSADAIGDTVQSLPDGYTVYCVANNCRDDTAAVVQGLAADRNGLHLIDVDYPRRNKTQAVLLGAVQARADGYTHILVLDDDVHWPDHPIEVLNRRAAVTAIPILPEQPRSLIEGLQVFEYLGTNLNKRCQTFFANDVTWASGAAAIFRVDTFLEVMRLHDGEFAGEDVQCSYLHHYLGHTIDFLPGTTVSTGVPRTLRQWWRQRAHSWDVSFMFLHLDLLLKVLFSSRKTGPGWWIRILTFYRIYDSLLVLVKLAVPLAILYAPAVTILFLGSTYVIFAMHYLSYPLFFPPLRDVYSGDWRGRVARAFLILPVYLLMTWASRLTAFPRAIRLKLQRPPLLGPFIDRNYAACTRVRVWSAEGQSAASTRDASVETAR